MSCVGPEQDLKLHLTSSGKSLERDLALLEPTQEGCCSISSETSERQRLLTKRHGCPRPCLVPRGTGLAARLPTLLLQLACALLLLRHCCLKQCAFSILAQGHKRVLSL